jgi:hypothetical protein
MAEELDYSYWADLRTRLEQALAQEQIVIRCHPLQLL